MSLELGEHPIDSDGPVVVHADVVDQIGANPIEVRIAASIRRMALCPFRRSCATRSSGGGPAVDGLSTRGKMHPSRT
jgi:hypothetical protein